MSNSGDMAHLSNSATDVSRVRQRYTVMLRHCYVSVGHNFKGFHGRDPGKNPVCDMAEVHCVSGRGIEGDRFFDFKKDFKGQITFFAYEVFRDLCNALRVTIDDPAALRRNIVTHGIDLNRLIGCEFEIQGVRFKGAEECRPCYWMDYAVALGAEAFLRGRGGLRARILTSGWLKSGLTNLTVL